MSDERYTVILGDRRYAIHRKWARLPPGESFGFLSDLMADRDGRQVLRFDTSGKLLQALGRRHWPNLDAPFNHPTAAAQASDGEIYVADGYGNSSVHRFAADGTLLATWGGPGAGPGAFTT